MIIVLHHSRYVLGYEQSIFIGGSLAVEFFFLVSGYLLMAHIGKVQKRTGSAAGGVTTSCVRHENGEQQGTEQTSCSRQNGGRRAGENGQGLGAETAAFLRGKVRAFLPEFVFSLLIGFLFVARVEHWGGRKIWGQIVHGFGEYTLLKMSGLDQGGIDGVVWYLSAMLLGMALLYPLIRRHYEGMRHLGLGLITVLIFGFLCQTSGTPRDPTRWMGFAYRGLLRCIAELSLGGVCYGCTKRLQAFHFNGFGRALLSLAELGCYLVPIRYMYRCKPSAEDYFYIFVLFLAIMLSFAERGLEDRPQRTGDGGLITETGQAARKTAAPDSARPEGSGQKAGGNRVNHAAGRRGRFASFCAKYSTALFLAHLYFAQHINTILPAETYPAGVRMAWYLGLSFANGLVVMGLAGVGRKKAGQGKKLVRKILLFKN